MSYTRSRRPRSAEEEEEGVSAKRSNLNLVYPFNNSQLFNITPPFINVGNGLQIENLTLSLNVGNGLYFDNGMLSVIGGAEFRTTYPLFYNEGTLTLKLSPSLLINEANELTLPALSPPLHFNGTEISLAVSKGFQLEENKLALNLDPIFEDLNGQYVLNCAAPLQKNGNILRLKTGNGLTLQNDQLECSIEAITPLVREEQNLQLKYGASLNVVENKLEVKVEKPLQLNNGLTLNFGQGLELKNNQLQVKIAPNSGLKCDDNGISLNLFDTVAVFQSTAATRNVSPVVVMSDPGKGTNANVEILDGKFFTVSGIMGCFIYIKQGHIEYFQFKDCPEDDTLNVSPLMFIADDFEDKNMKTMMSIQLLNLPSDINTAGISAICEWHTTDGDFSEWCYIKISTNKKKNTYLEIYRTRPGKGKVNQFCITVNPCFVTLNE